MSGRDQMRELGEDLTALLARFESAVLMVKPVTTLPSGRSARACFLIELENGRRLKGRLVESPADAERIEHLSRLLSAPPLQKVLARRGPALLLEWIDGTTLKPDAALDVVTRCGELHGALHTTSLPAGAPLATDRLAPGWELRLEGYLRELVGYRALDRKTCRRIRTLALEHAPISCAAGLTHGDFCPENLIVDDAGHLWMVDGETLSIDAFDYDLGRTLYRWPMGRAQRDAYFAGYTQRRRPTSFVRHFPFWAVMVLIDSALFRYRRGTRDAVLPVQRLHDLVADAAKTTSSNLSGVSLAALRDGKSVFFVSDFHLGLAGQRSSIDREKQIVRWLESIQDEASDIFILGDMFDLWFEYRTVVPKGFVRLLGKLASLADQGIQIHLFAGNHERWGVDYLRDQVGAVVYMEPQVMELKGKMFYLGHGDKVSRGAARPGAALWLAAHSLARLAGSWLHPDLGLPLAAGVARWKRASKRRRPIATPPVSPDEALLRHARSIIETRPDLDYLVFGHRHSPVLLRVTDRASCVDVGDWLTHASYAVFDGEGLRLKSHP